MGIHIITNKKLWMEQDAVHQLRKISKYEGGELRQGCLTCIQETPDRRNDQNFRNHLLIFDRK